MAAKTAHVCPSTTDTEASRLGERTIDSPRAQSRQHEQAALLAAIAMTAGAGIPAAVVQLIALVGHGQPVDDLAICGAGWVHIHCAHIVWSMAICISDDQAQPIDCNTVPGLQYRAWPAGGWHGRIKDGLIGTHCAHKTRSMIHTYTNDRSGPSLRSHKRERQQRGHAFALHRRFRHACLREATHAPYSVMTFSDQNT